MINVNMGVKSKTVGVEYIPFKRITLEGEQKVFTKMVERKVVKVRNIQKIKKWIRTGATALGVVMSMGTRALASGVTGGTPVLSPLTPSMMMEYGLQIAFLSVSVAVGLSMVLLTVAGMLRMFRKSHEASAWTQDILKGTTQVLISIPSIYVIYKVASYLFRNLNFLSLGL